MRHIVLATMVCAAWPLPCGWTVVPFTQLSARAAQPAFGKLAGGDVQRGLRRFPPLGYAVGTTAAGSPSRTRSPTPARRASSTTGMPGPQLPPARPGSVIWPSRPTSSICVSISAWAKIGVGPAAPIIPISCTS